MFRITEDPSSGSLGQCFAKKLQEWFYRVRWHGQGRCYGSKSLAKAPWWWILCDPKQHVGALFKYFIIVNVSTYYILCISWIIKCLKLLTVCEFRENLRKEDCKKKIAFVFSRAPWNPKTFWKYRRLCWNLCTAPKSTAVKTSFLSLPIF